MRQSKKDIAGHVCACGIVHFEIYLPVKYRLPDKIAPFKRLKLKKLSAIIMDESKLF